ncbi:unnamed protein product [Bursaphelenchus xylophilus]|uniref:(pine wood nematode) hypothetical protein n=1 Tax=Bursaphelenchus xylophilus TaxID=6326 RepID=A0A1I7SEM5_BURXY|nr:unnamed protein product [Bursaphelenchus xylophilus]CAG9113653.1 unnamed protein product [Bursaphelenchus xylophilus]
MSYRLNRSEARGSSEDARLTENTTRQVFRTQLSGSSASANHPAAASSRGTDSGDDRPSSRPGPTNPSAEKHHSSTSKTKATGRSVEPKKPQTNQPTSQQTSGVEPSDSSVKQGQLPPKPKQLLECVILQEPPPRLSKPNQPREPSAPRVHFLLPSDPTLQWKPPRQIPHPQRRS